MGQGMGTDGGGDWAAGDSEIRKKENDKRDYSRSGGRRKKEHLLRDVWREKSSRWRGRPCVWLADAGRVDFISFPAVIASSMGLCLMMFPGAFCFIVLCLT